MPDSLSPSRSRSRTRDGPSLVISWDEDRPTATRLMVSGAIDRGTAPMFRAAMRETVGRASGQVYVDMREVTFCDAAGLRALIAPPAILGEGQLMVIGPCPPLALLLQLLELESYINIIPAKDAEPAGRGHHGGRHDQI